MTRSPSSIRSVCRLSAIGAGIVAFATAAANAQSGGSKIVMMNNDNGTPSMAHFSMPDILTVRQPDFLKRDLPTFTEKLLLSDDQTSAMQRQIDAYLEAFDKLVKEHLTTNFPQPVVMKALGGGESAAGAIVIGPDNLDELPQISLDDLDNLDDAGVEGMGMSLNFRVEADAGDEGDGGAAPAGDGNPAPSVAITFQTSNGQEMPEELRKQLEKRASEMAEKIKAQIEQQMAEGKEPAAAAAIGPMGGDIEQMKQQQEQVTAEIATFRKAKAALRQSFVAEAQSTLAPPQVERWPALERALLREKTLPQGRLSGERTNLFKVIKGLNLQQPQQTAIAGQLDAYDIALDAALRQRNEYIDDVNPKIDKAMEERNFDKSLSLMDRAADLRIAVRSVNEQFTEAIAELLPAEFGSTLRAAALKTSYPQVYRTTFAQKSFMAAQKIEGLDQKTLDGVKELDRAYEIELNETNTQIRNAVHKQQPLEPRQPIQHMKAMMAGAAPEDEFLGGNDADPVRAAFEKRRDLDERYTKALTSLLPPEKADLLPKAPVRRQAGEPIIIRRTAGE